MYYRYKRSKFQPDASNEDLLHIFEIQSESIGRSAMAVASLKRPFWYRRSLHRKFSQAAMACEAQEQPAHESVQEHPPGLGRPSPPSACQISLRVFIFTSFLCSDPAASEGSAKAKKPKSPLSINFSQEHGAILLPLRLRSNRMPLLIVNTHLNCNAF